ncbi:MAG: SAM-dependent methyltransferase [Nocardiopsaceae bacterium]|nr:SAM-dependent methyltransferase [Nocardiopsaceae bacterium]
MTRALNLPRGLDATRPTPARIYDYMLRGQHYYNADARAAERILGIVPELRDMAWSNRGFHQRSAAWIADQGIRQFLDIGAGLPAVGNTHEVVQSKQPGARVVYVDNDPLVDLYSKQILDCDDTVRVICADPAEPDTILDHPSVRALIDPDQPTGLLMTGVMTFVAEESRPHELVARYARRQAPGSYLALSHMTDDAKPPAAVEGCRSVFETATEHLHFRSKREVATFFDGMELLPPYAGADPEVTYCGVWGAEDVKLADSEGSRWLYCGVARIP